MTNFARIVQRLHGVRAREERVALKCGLLLAAAAVAVILIAAFALEAIARFDVTGRTVLFAVTGTGVLASIAGFAGPSLLRAFALLPRKNEDRVALDVGGHFPDIKDRLLNVLQIVREMRAAKHPNYSPALVDASFGEVAGAFDGLDLTPVVDTAPLRKSARIALIASGVALAAFGVFPSSLGDAAGRIARFRTDFAPPAPFEFLVEPGDIEAVKGERIVLRAKTTARHQPAVSFSIREAEQNAFDATPARKDSGGAYTHAIGAIRGSLVYFAEAEGYRSREYAINVVDRPFVRSLRLKLAFPSYTKLPPRYLDENVGDVTALPGTSVGFELALNKEVARAALQFSDSQSMPLAVNGMSASGTLPLRKERQYHIGLVDHAGIPNANPITYALKLVPDMAPSVELLEPEQSVDLDETMRLPLVASIADDFGFSKLQLHYRLSASKYEQPKETFSSVVIPLPSGQKNRVEVPYIWNLSSLQLVPEDVVSYFVEVFDNDAVNGPKTARSQIYTVRLPSIDEVFAKADKTQDKAIEDLQKTLNTAEDVRKEMEDLRRELKSQNSDKLDWQQKKKLEELLKRQEKMVEDVSKVSEQLSKLSEDMQKQNMISEETMKKYQELQQLMKEIDAPEFREALKRMNEAMQQMTPEQMKQAMENFTFNEEMFQRSIDRTMELLKRLQVEQKVDELTRRAEELAKKQNDLADRTAATDPKDKEELDRLAKEQEELKKQTEAMQREMSELMQKMGELPPQEMPLQEMQDAQSELNLAEMQQQMSEAAGQCQGGNCKSASMGQKKLGAQMQKFQKKMEQVKKKLSEDQNRMVQQAFKKALENALALSRKQEQLKNETTKLPVNSQQFREMMQQQLDVMEQLNSTANDLMELSKKTFAVSPQMGRHLGEAMKNMREALENMQNRNSRASGEEQGGAMAELNEAAKQIAKGMQSQKSGGGQGGSLMSQLQQMARQQMGINQSTQQLGESGMSMEQAAQMRRLAQQQTALQKSLSQLNEEAKRSAEGKRLLGDLEKVTQEMQEVVRDLQQNDVNANTLQKQERILSRLLDASRSMHERDWEKKRRSETGTDVARRSPSALDPNLLDPREGLKRDLQRAVNEGYSRDYEALIRQYFDALEKVIGDEGRKAGGAE